VCPVFVTNDLDYRMKKYLFFATLLSIVLSCNNSQSEKFKIKSYPVVKLTSDSYDFKNFPADISSIDDSILLFFPLPMSELLVFNSFSGKHISTITLPNEIIDRIKSDLLLPEMKNFNIISRDSFVSATEYDPGDIEFNQISKTGDDYYIGFNIPVYFIDTVNRQYRYNPAVFIGKITGQDISSIIYLPGQHGKDNLSSSVANLNQEWPFLTYGFKVMDSIIYAFNLTKSSVFADGNIPVIMKYGNCVEDKCFPLPHQYPEIFLAPEENENLSSLIKGSAIFNNNGKSTIVYWDNRFYSLPKGKEVYKWIKNNNIIRIYDFDFFPDNERYMTVIAETENDEKITPKIYSILVLDMEKEKTILNVNMNDSTQSINKQYLKVFGKNIYYLNAQNNELHHFKVE
jgi:hypothetical protein